MRNIFFVLIIFSIVSVGMVFGQEKTVASAVKQPGKVASIDVPTVRGYRLLPGDEVSVKVLAEQDYNFVATVDENGRLEVPFASGPIMAKCKTEPEIRTEITDLLSKYLVSPQLNLRTERKSRPIATIYGEVRDPSKVELTRKTTLIELIAFSGGVKEEAGGKVQVFRTQRPMCSDGAESDNWRPETEDATEVPSRVFDLASINLGLDEANPEIFPGDVVIVQKAFPAYVTGEVIAPQGILLKGGGTSLMDAIGLVSGLRREAKTKDVRIYRRINGSKDREVISLNLDLIKKGEQKDILLEPYDIIEVDKSKKSIALTILEVMVGAGRSVVQSAANQTGYKILY